jgi:hypothetical protein
VSEKDPWSHWTEVGLIDPDLPPWSKGTAFDGAQVVINDYLPTGAIIVSDDTVTMNQKPLRRTIVMNRESLRRTIMWYTAREVALHDIKRIVEREMADVLTWLRGAGHDV